MSATATQPKPHFWRRKPREKPPPPLDATLLRHPLRWVKNKLLLAVDGLALVHVGTLIVVALYYVAFQTIPGVKYDWDHALTGGLHFWGLRVHFAPLSTAHWAQWRHLIRNVGEGLLGGTLGQAIIWNHFKVKPKPRNWVDRLEISLHIPNLKDDRRTSGWQMLALPLLVLVYATPGFAVGAGVAHLIQHSLAHVQLHQVSSDAVIQSLWTGNVSQRSSVCSLRSCSAVALAAASMTTYSCSLSSAGGPWASRSPSTISLYRRSRRVTTASTERTPRLR